MKRPRSRKVKRAELRELLSSGKWSIDPVRSNKLSEVYLGPEGRLLFVVGGGEVARLYESKVEFDAMAAALANQPASGSAIADKWHREVPKDVPALVEELRGAVPLGEGSLDFSVGSLGAVDEFLRANSRKRWGYFEQVVAYFGEVLRQAKDGEWIEIESMGTREPYVVSPGERFPVGLWVFEEMELGARGSLQGVARAMLEYKRLGGRDPQA
jgi:hypothetical protein